MKANRVPFVGLLLLAACEAPDSAPAEINIKEMLATSDPETCSFSQVQDTAIKALLASLDAATKGEIEVPSWEEFTKAGGQIPFEDVSLIDAKKDVSEITCRSNIRVNGSRYELDYKVRPSAGGGANDIIVEPVESNESLAMLQDLVDAMSKQVDLPKTSRTSPPAQQEPPAVDAYEQTDEPVSNQEIDEQMASDLNMADE